MINPERKLGILRNRETLEPQVEVPVERGEQALQDYGELADNHEQNPVFGVPYPEEFQEAFPSSTSAQSGGAMLLDFSPEVVHRHLGKLVDEGKLSDAVGGMNLIQEIIKRKARSHTQTGYN
jgi:hypothetical protein